MTAFHAPGDAGGRRDTIAMNDNHAFLIEVYDRSAGIVIAERGGYRFFAADQDWSSLDGQRFTTVPRAEQAARRLHRTRRARPAGEPGGRGPHHTVAHPRPGAALARPGGA